MSAGIVKQAAAEKTGTVAEFWRLSRAIEQFQATAAAERDSKRALALLDELTTVTAALKTEAGDVRRQLSALRQGLEATKAYQRTKIAVSRRDTGDRK